MNEFDFKSWYIVLTIFIAHIYRHYSLMDKIKERTSDLSDLLNSGQFNAQGLRKKRNNLISTILCIEAIMLHFLAFILLFFILFLVFNFPNNLFNPDDFGELSSPMLKGEKIIYLLVAGLFFISYTIKGILPTISAIKKIFDANTKLKNLKHE